jgi:hypothetical protein
MLLTSAHKKCLAQKVVCFGSLEWIPIIRAPFNSSCAALQYETGMKFFDWVVPELHADKILQKIITLYTFTYKPMTTEQKFLGTSRISIYQRPSWSFAEGCWNFLHKSMRAIVDRKCSHYPPILLLNTRERGGERSADSYLPNEFMLFSFDISWLTQCGTGTTLTLYPVYAGNTHPHP